MKELTKQVEQLEDEVNRVLGYRSRKLYRGSKFKLRDIWPVALVPFFIVLLIAWKPPFILVRNKGKVYVNKSRVFIMSVILSFVVYVGIHYEDFIEMIQKLT